MDRPPSDAPVLVICDRRREEGLSGEDPFEAFGALLDFEPVPRKARRADGGDQIEWEAKARAEAAAWRDRVEAGEEAEQVEEAVENPSFCRGEGNAAEGGEGEGTKELPCAGGGEP